MRSTKENWVDQECKMGLENLKTVFEHLHELEELNQKREKLRTMSYLAVGFAGGLMVGILVMLLRSLL